MAKLAWEDTPGGGLRIYTDTGAEYRLVARDGGLEVRVPEGDLVVQPRSSNVVELAVKPW